MSRLHHAWLSRRHYFRRNKSINRLDASMYEYNPKHVHRCGSGEARYIITMTVLKRGKQTFLECNNNILNMAYTSKPTTAISFKQYSAAYDGLL